MAAAWHRGDGTMVVTTCLAYLVVRHRWGWSRGVAVAALLPFLALDLVFFGANILRVIEGLVPLLVGAGVGLIIIPGCAGGVSSRPSRSSRRSRSPTLQPRSPSGRPSGWRGPPCS
jgi:hypothetical protein